MLFLFKRFDGLNWVVIGEENIPDTPFIIASKHQSIWDTIFFTAYFSDAAMVLKKILIYLPAYGWHAVKAKMIWVDRKAKGKALKQLLKMAKECSSNNRPIVIFPEGTRVNVEDKVPFKKGVGRIYEALNISCVPVALNSGRVWPKHGILKCPGKITVSFLKAIEPGLDRDNFLKNLETKIYNEIKNIS